MPYCIINIYQITNLDNIWVSFYWQIFTILYSLPVNSKFDGVFVMSGKYNPRWQGLPLAAQKIIQHDIGDGLVHLRRGLIGRIHWTVIA